jgi:hypothetical protein
MATRHARGNSCFLKATLIKADQARRLRVQKKKTQTAKSSLKSAKWCSVPARAKKK